VDFGVPDRCAANIYKRASRAADRGGRELHAEAYEFATSA